MNERRRNSATYTGRFLCALPFINKSLAAKRFFRRRGLAFVSVYERKFFIGGNDGAESTVTELLPTAPDGGYGWVIVFAAFMHNFIMDGIANSFGTFLPIYQKHFNSSTAITTFIGSALIGCYHLMGIGFCF